MINAITNVIRAQKNGEMSRHRIGFNCRLNVFSMRMSSNDDTEDDVG